MNKSECNETMVEVVGKYEFDALAGIEHLITFVEILAKAGHVKDVHAALEDVLEVFPKNASAFRQEIDKLRGSEGKSKVSKAQALIARAKATA